MEIWQIIIGCLGALGGLAGMFSSVAYYKRIGRKYDVETDTSEINNLRSIINILQKSKDDLETRVYALENALGVKNAQIVTLESECTKRERAMNCQPLCEMEYDKCPIIIKYNELIKH